MERYVGYYWMVEKLPPPATAQQAIGASRPLWRLRTNYIKPELEKFPIYMVGMAKIGDAYCKDDVRISSAEDVYDALRWVRLPLASEDFTQWVRRAVEALKRSDRVAVSPALDTDVLLDGVTAKAAEWFEEYKKLPRDKGWRAKEEKIPRDNSFCR